ncbi:MAG: hypothetical protein ABI763_14470, partial [Bacteroidota bacterium]
MKRVSQFLKFYGYPVLFFLVFFSNEALKAQVVIDTFSMPAGYGAYAQMKNAMEIDPANNIWIGFKLIGAGKFDGANWIVYDTLDGLPANNVLSLAFQGPDTWMGTTKGLAKFDGTSFTVFDTSNSSLTDNNIQSLFVNGNDLWIGTHDGLFLFDGTTWTHYNTLNSLLPGDTVNCFERTGNDTIWIGTTNGIAGFQNGSWKVYSNFFPGYTRPNILCIKKDAAEKLLLEGHNQKIFVLEGDSIYSGQFFFPLFCSGEIPGGSLVGLNTFGNVCILNQNSIGEINIAQSQSWHCESGFYNTMFSNGHRQAFAVLDQNGRIWYAGNSQKLIAIDYHNMLVQELPTDDCNEFLDANNVSARIHPGGTLFWDLINNPQYEVPKGTGQHTLFADELWIGGLDPGNNLHMAAQMYRQSGSDFWPGPLDTTNATVDSATVEDYTRLWKINRYTITEFKNEFALGNVTNLTYPVPDIILNWPASGTGNYSRDLAPYVDVNNDGVYNPYDGDFPDMKGDQMIWLVFNDNYFPHHETSGVSLGIEVQLSAYAYRCNVAPDTEQVVNYSTFFHYRIINRSNTDYTQLYMGRYTDVDLGNYLDDYVGCDSSLDIAYVYNGDNLDEGSAGYGLNPPIQNVLYLNQPLTNFMYFNNNSSPVNGNPQGADDFYGYLQSRWRNDVHLTYGGNGNQGTDSVNYMYSSNPYD